MKIQEKIKQLIQLSGISRDTRHFKKKLVAWVIKNDRSGSFAVLWQNNFIDFTNEITFQKYMKLCLKHSIDSASYLLHNIKNFNTPSKNSLKLEIKFWKKISEKK
jgi:hypothetical protein